MRTIVLAIVGDDDGAAAVAEAIRQAQWRKARVVAVSTQGDTPATPVYSSPGARDTVAQALAKGGVEHEVVFAQGHAAEQVLDLAGQHSAELIVLGTRKRSPVMKLFLGSAAQQIILEAECPVLTVRSGIGSPTTEH